MTNRDNSSRPRPGAGRCDVRRTPSGERGRLDVMVEIGAFKTEILVLTMG